MAEFFTNVTVEDAVRITIEKNYVHFHINP